MASSKGRKRHRPKIVIRAMEGADAEALSAVFGSKSVVAGTLQIPHTSAEERRARFESRSPEDRLLVAELDGKVVGMVGVHPSSRPRMRHVASIGMAVAEAYQRQGVGTALLDAAIELAEKWLGILRIELCVWVDNKAAIALYRNRGFEIEGVARAYALRDGEVVDAFHMARIAERMPWARVTAEEVAQRTPPQLPSGRSSSGNGGSKEGRGPVGGWLWGWKLDDDN